MAASVFLAACGHGKARTGIPTKSPVKISDSDLEGIASYYAEPYHGRRTANGEVFDTYNGMTAAHKTLPFNTVVRVKNLDNGEEVDVRINDRGPFVKGRVIDLSLIAAKQIELDRSGVAPVKLKVLKDGSPTVPAPVSVPPLYGVQIGAFQNEAAAIRLRDDLATRYTNVSILSLTDQTLYRVRVGSVMDMDAAEQLARQLRSENFSTLIVRLN